MYGKPEKGAMGMWVGMRRVPKFMLQLVVALISACLMYFKLGISILYIPLIGITLNLGLFYIPFAVFVIVAFSNAFNITDGLDGLAGGLLVTAYGTFGLIAILQGNFGIAGFCLTIVGALLSYLWFNIFPARFFMGDVGSFAFGTTLAVIAIMLNATLLLPIIGIVFVVEVCSVIMQLLSKRILHRKIFRSAPVHHHFEALGWPETKVTMRFWVLGQVAGVLGLLIAVLGGFLKL